MTEHPQGEVALHSSKVATLPPRAASLEQNSDITSASGVRPRSLLRQSLWMTFYLAAWLATCLLILVAGLRLFYHDGEFILIWINSFTRYLYAPAYLSFAWAIWQRRWVLSVGSLAIVGFHLELMAPDFLRDRRFDAPLNAGGLASADMRSERIRIFFGNVAASNTEHDAMLAEIAEADPDVIVFVEFSRPWYVAIKNSPVMAPYIYGSGHLTSHLNSINVFSRLPLTTEIQNWVRRRAIHTIELPLNSGTLRLIGLHAPRPIDGPQFDYLEYWDETIALLTTEPGPLIVVGDFNVTEHSLVYKRLTEGRLRSAHDDRGRGYATTWPNGQYLCPPIRIDHAFVSPEIEVERIVEGCGRGSNHKPLILDLRVRGTWQQ